MSLGLPDHLAREAGARALAAGAHAAGLAALCFALANVVIAAIASGEGADYLTVLAIVPMAGLIVVLSRRRTLTTTIAYLVVGSLSTYFYTWALLQQTPSYHDTSLFVFALPVIAMSLVGGAGTGALVGVLWCSLGFALAQAMVLLAALAAGRLYAPNAVSMSAYLVAVVVLLVEAYSRHGRRRSQAAIYRAVRRGQLIRLRQELARGYAAELHDATVSELIAIAGSPPGPLTARLRDRIEADLVALGEDRLGRPDAGRDRLAGVLRPGSGLHQAVEAARDEGLSIEVTGDPDALDRVSEERARALGLAVRQCLLNVLRHSGTSAAEIAVEAAGSRLTVLVVDSGRGFVETDADGDRLGLRHSVRGRIERVGGEVTIWSAPGAGTTVMLSVPCRSEGLPAGDQELVS